MDPITFSLAVAGIPAIFKSCVDCFQYIHLSKSFGQHFGFCLAELEAVDVEFTRWGEAMGLLDEPFDPNTLFQEGSWKEEDIKKAKKWLALILDTFEDAKRMSDRFKASNEDDEPELVEVPDQKTELEKAQQPVKKLVFSLRKLTKKRQRVESLGRKIQWALYKKDDFDGLIKEVSGLVEKLVKLFPAFHQKQVQLCEQEVKDIEPESIPTLIKVLDGRDELLNRALAKKTLVNGHKLRGAVITKEGKIVIGDDFENVFDTLAPGADVSDVKVDDKGSLSIGHKYKISTEVAMAKLKLGQ
ncbi:uncharacterized protein LY89DRAFT_721633 [Mollisia scopiformis]|uniref:Prion-inhibition and propagation HeLo domain-containing protein n=1 Tax=Mollisia scopiformis TaxID=149040 RepID=A0A194WXQ5_MOLSC|nr:uncharacterized protein LY89DRAFT_721633 [Mollisia scopiformis]KUJ12761.1 hypothetical protein LY89DRAFT_721633 [Mollisia scopiformis]